MDYVQSMFDYHINCYFEKIVIENSLQLLSDICRKILKIEIFFKIKYYMPRGRKSGPIRTIFNGIYFWAKARLCTKFYQNISSNAASRLTLKFT